MSRTIYTERDIEDFAKRGVKELAVDENVYLTDLAREKMQALGINAKFLSTAPTPMPQSPAGATLSLPDAAPRLNEEERRQVIEQVKSGVIARLGSGVDAAMLDTLVRRVVGRL